MDISVIDPKILTAVIAAVVSILTAVLTSWITVKRLRREFLLEMRAEDLARRLLTHSKWRFRTFKTLNYHIAGFDEDELRRVLIRAGAVRFQDTTGVEIWGLLERVSDLIDDKNGTNAN